MKKFIPILSLAILAGACTQPSNTGTQTPAVTAAPATPVYNPDTVGLAQFQEWKAANERADVKDYNTVQYAKAPAVKRTKKVYTAPRKQNAGGPASTDNGTATPAPAGNGPDTINSESSNTAKAPEKKGWSKAAKGTAIGTGAGAAAGAIISKKNRVVGGVIGGVVGGAVGYGIGRHMDKKDGRY